VGDGVAIELEGGRELSAYLKGLPDKVRKRTIGRALRKGALPLLDHAVANAPVADEAHTHGGVTVAPGTMQRSMTVSKRRSRDGDDITYAIGPSRNVWYGFFTEMGTKYIAPMAWLESALDSGHQESLNAVIKVLQGSMKRWKAKQRKLANG